MKLFRHALLLFCCTLLAGGLLSARAAAWGRPTVMQWDDFYELYQAAGSTDSETHDLQLMGNVNLTGGIYELGPTDTEVHIIADAPYSFVMAGDATLIVNNPNLTVHAENHPLAPFIISGGYLDLRGCAIETLNCSAIVLMSDGTHLLTGGGGGVNINVAYEGPNVDDAPRAGLACGMPFHVPLRLHDANLTVRGGEAAIVANDSVELYGCNIRAESETGATAVLLLSKNITLTMDEWTTVYPAADAVLPPEPPLPPEEFVLDGYYSDPWTDLATDIECLSGVSPANLPLAAATEATYKTEDGYGSLEDVPIHWDISALPDPLVKGTYTVCGDFDAEVLAANHIVNPDNIRVEVPVRVFAPGPYEGLQVEAKDLGDGVFGVAYGNLPTLTDATAIYAEFCTDGETWFRAKIKTTLFDEDISAYSENLMDDPFFDVENQPFTVKLEIGKVFDTRLVIEGTPFEGATNVIKVGSGEESEGTDNGGDHGGGGQGSHDRYGKTELQTEYEAAPETEEQLVSEVDAEPAAEPEASPPLPAGQPKGDAPGDPAPVFTARPNAPAVSAKPTLPIPKAVSAMEQASAASAEISPPGLPANAEEDVPALQPPVSAPQPNTVSTSESEAPSARVPGFATATIVTCVLILGGAAWFRRRGL